jgi:lambda family phage portal protein
MILGPDGNPLNTTKRADAIRSRNRALSGGGNRSWNGPYDAASLTDQHFENWQPYLGSVDSENVYRDRITARVRDLVRNDGWAAGAVTRILDSAIGAHLRPIPNPDYHYLALVTGNKAFDHTWAREFSKAIDAHWQSWAETDTGLYCDVHRLNNFTQMMALAFRHLLVDGDAIARLRWLPKRIGMGKARFATCVEGIDPDRLSNPQLRFDNETMRGGVEVDADGVAKAYYIREAHAGDWWAAAKALTWTRVERETSWSRPIIIHAFEPNRFYQHRGVGGIFLPILPRIKMLAKYDSTELDSAIINSIFAAYIQSPFDKDLVADALDDDEHLDFYQESRGEFHKDSKIVLGNARIPLLFPGEEIKSVSANRPATNFAGFESAVMNNCSSALGISAAQFSNDFSKVNYSSSRSAMLEAHKTLHRRLKDFCVRMPNPIRNAFLEELFETEDLPLPKGAPSFIEFRGAYAKARWCGPPRGWIDPVAEVQGDQMKCEAGFTTLRDVCAEQGQDFEEVLEQRAYEINKFKELGIPAPEWTNVDAAKEAQAKTVTADAAMDAANAKDEGEKSDGN